MDVPYLDKRLFMRKEKDIGYGVFTCDSIGKGTLIEVAALLLCDPKFQDEKEICNYTIAWGEKIAIGMGWTMYYNHSDNNCCDFYHNYNNCLLAIATNRDVNKHEQLTVNYGPTWFESRGIKKIKI
jgi:hypothetical protein